MRSMLAAMVLLLCGLSYAQDDESDRRLDMYAQFSGMNIDNLTGTGGPNTSLAKGVDLGAAWYPVAKISLVGDFDYHEISDSSSRFSAVTLMGGPRFWSGEHYRLSCYWQLLGGGARLSQSGGFNPGKNWAGVGALGGGIEVRVTRRIVLRPIAVDLMLVSVPHNMVGSGQIGTGLVFRLR